MMSAMKPVLAVVTHMEKPLTTKVSTTNTIIVTPMWEMVCVPTVFLVMIKNRIMARFAKMLLRVQVTMLSLWPCLPA